MLALDAHEERAEAFRVVGNLEFFEPLTVGQADGHAVLTTTDIDADVQLGGKNPGNLRRFDETVGESPTRLVSIPSHCPMDRHPPGRHKRMMQEDEGGISRQARQTLSAADPKSHIPVSTSGYNL